MTKICYTLHELLINVTVSFITLTEADVLIRTWYGGTN